MKIGAILIAVAGLAACGASSDPRDGTTAALPGTVAYTLAPGDKLKIKVFDEPDLSGEYQIDENGKIAFPLVGDIRAGGHGLEDFRLLLVEELKGGFVRNPRVTMDILNYRPINIIGEVKNPGQFPYRPGMSAQDISAIAGGYTYRANETTFLIIRDSHKNPISVTINDGHFPILPGDNIKIPERFF